MARRLSSFVRQHGNDLVHERIGVWIQRHEYSVGDCDIDVHCIDDRRLPHGLSHRFDLLVDQMGAGSSFGRLFPIGRPFHETVQHATIIQSHDRCRYLYSHSADLLLDVS